MILSGIWRGARARKMTTNYMSAEYGVNRWDFSDIMSYVNCWWRRCALRSAVQWDDDVVLRHTESSERASNDGTRRIKTRWYHWDILLLLSEEKRNACSSSLAKSDSVHNSVIPSRSSFATEKISFLYDFTYVRVRYNLIQNVWWWNLLPITHRRWWVVVEKKRVRSVSEHSK